VRRAWLWVPLILGCGGLSPAKPVDGGLPDEMPPPACTGLLSVDKSMLMVGTIAPGGVASGTVELTNVSACPSGDVTITTSPGISARGCSSPLAARASCTLTITVDPAIANPSSSVVWISASPGAVTPLQVSVAWTVYYIPPFSVHPAAFDFGPTPLGIPLPPVELKVNTVAGLADLTVAAWGPDVSIDAALTTCGSALPANGTCVVAMTFLGSSVGDKAAGVTLTGGSPRKIVTIPITANVVSGVHLVLDPPGPAGASALAGRISEPVPFDVLNRGNIPTGPLAVTITGPDAAEFAATSACTTLAPLETCKLAVVFQPALDSLGRKTALLEVRDTGSSNAIVTASLVSMVMPPP
jgi:hypothetical protein